jgi:hypothetical protein
MADKSKKRGSKPVSTVSTGLPAFAAIYWVRFTDTFDDTVTWQFVTDEKVARRMCQECGGTAAGGTHVTAKMVTCPVGDWLPMRDENVADEAADDEATDNAATDEVAVGKTKAKKAVKGTEEKKSASFPPGLTSVHILADIAEDDKKITRFAIYLNLKAAKKFVQQHMAEQIGSDRADKLAKLKERCTQLVQQDELEDFIRDYRQFRMDIESASFDLDHFPYAIFSVPLNQAIQVIFDIPKDDTVEVFDPMKRWKDE